MVYPPTPKLWKIKSTTRIYANHMNSGFNMLNAFRFKDPIKRMLQSRMGQNRICLVTAFHATSYKFLSIMQHATRKSMFIIGVCSMLKIFNVIFFWAHHAKKSQENSLMTQENVRIKARIFH